MRAANNTIPRLLRSISGHLRPTRRGDIGFVSAPDHELARLVCVTDYGAIPLLLDPRARCGPNLGQGNRRYCVTRRSLLFCFIVGYHERVFPWFPIHRSSTFLCDSAGKRRASCSVRRPPWCTRYSSATIFTAKSLCHRLRLRRGFAT